MNWEETVNLVKQIPYGRNANRLDFSLVISENKGTCSSKHAFLKDFADKNNIPNVELIIGIYKMTESNTNIGKILSENNIDYIPEAHCYLKVNNERLDVTSKEANFEKIKYDLLEEKVIQPFQVSDYKVAYHKDYLKKWIAASSLNHNFEEIWRIREKCIESLSK